MRTRSRTATSVSAEDWTRSSLVDVAAALRHRKVGAAELLETTLSRIETLEPEVHAFVEVTADLARRQARVAQRVLDQKGLDAPPLTGVPFALKDLFDVRCVVTTAGSRVLRHNVAVRDSAAWRRLREAGAVLVGKVNTHEFAYGGTTEPTRNPWDTSRMVGGSSGGSGAALADYSCFGALGTDTAGSVRIPAALCGVVGLKPTRGTVSTRGVIPLSPTLDSVGPMGRTPEDVRTLFRLLRSRRPRPESTARPQRGWRIGVLSAQGAIEPAVRAAVTAAAEAFADVGAQVDEVENPPNLADAAAVNFTIMAAEAARMHRKWLHTQPDDYSPYVRERLLEALNTSAADYLDALDAARAITHAWDDLVERFDAILLNGVPFTAPPAYVDQVVIGGVSQDRDALLCRDLAFANVTGHPALAVPAGSAAGLPVGVQLVGAAHTEERLLSLGQVVFDRLAHPCP